MAVVNCCRKRTASFEVLVFTAISRRLFRRPTPPPSGQPPWPLASVGRSGQWHRRPRAEKEKKQKGGPRPACPQRSGSREILRMQHASDIPALPCHPSIEALRRNRLTRFVWSSWSSRAGRSGMRLIAPIIPTRAVAHQVEYTQLCL